MPWIEPEYLNCSVYLYPSEAEAEDGAKIGGSGFLLSIPLLNEMRYGRGITHNLGCVVTNKHVIDAGNKTVRLNTKDGNKVPIPLDGAEWFEHSTSDIAICPIQLDIDHEFSSVSVSALLTDKIISDFDIGPGDDVFMIGRFVNHEGKQKNTPSLRFGNIAQMPFEPIHSVGLPPQESFLVEYRSVAGYSGSPVFVYLPPQPNLDAYPEIYKAIQSGSLRLPGINPKRIVYNLRAGPWLLGVDWCHIRDEEYIWNRLTKKTVSPEWFVKSNTGMAGVVPAWKIFDILNGEGMKKAIAEATERARELAKKGDGIELDAAVGVPEKVTPIAPEDSNPSHQEDFKKLLGAAVKSPRSTD